MFLETYTTAAKGTHLELPDFLQVVREVTGERAYSMFTLSLICDAASAASKRSEETGGKIACCRNVSVAHEILGICSCSAECRVSFAPFSSFCLLLLFGLSFSSYDKILRYSFCNEKLTNEFIDWLLFCFVIQCTRKWKGQDTDEPGSIDERKVTKLNGVIGKT